MLAAYPEVEDVFDRAESLTGIAVKSLLTKATEEEISRVENAHLAVFLYSAALGEVAAKLSRPGVVFGHSLGEFSALYAAGVLDFESALHLVVERGRLIASGVRRRGSMVALIGENVLRFAEEVLKDFREKTLSIANYNSPTQIVLSGRSGDVERAVKYIEKKARRIGARLRAVRLKVGFASHSPLVGEVSKVFSRVIEGVRFRRAEIPVALGTSGEITRDAIRIKENLKANLHSPVRFMSVVKSAAEFGITRVWEVGPGKVLSGLIRRIHPSLQTTPLDPQFGNTLR